jgi:hypothetical protein
MATRFPIDRSFCLPPSRPVGPQTLRSSTGKYRPRKYLRLTHQVRLTAIFHQIATQPGAVLLRIVLKDNDLSANSAVLLREARFGQL